MLKGLMMDRPLLVSSLIDFAAEVHSKVTITTSTVEGGLHRYSIADARVRIARLANALLALGVRPGDRVATLAWNTYRHFELYYAISGIGAVCHTINPRLFPDQLRYIVNHAEDRLLFFDLTFLPIVEKMRAECQTVGRYIALTDRVHMPAAAGMQDLICYEDLVATGDDGIVWPEFDENAACALCYTSGTTGEPKGALFSHRSTVLHTLFVVSCLPSAFGSGKPLLPVVPLFHVNAWGLPYAAMLSGTPLVFPGPRLDGASLFDLLDGETVYSTWGVPTVWLGVLAEMKKRGRKPKNFSEVIVGGSAAPPAMIAEFERDYGINVVHAWGMTEMSPVGTFGNLSVEMQAAPLAQRLEIKTRQGQRLFGVDFKIVDEAGNRQPHDGVAQGELLVRGPTVVSGYFNNAEASVAAIDEEGWFRTGDVAKVTADGYLTLVDRTKDLVKSGGEWISSIDVENAVIGCPGVANAAVIAVPHHKWDERPLLVVVKASGADPCKEDILGHLATRLAKWQVPDDVVFVEALPLTATGKVSKRDLRQKFSDFKLVK
jgi:acyl-CoA synthetase (AMP-forming)/AMP-acid ligase II